jgi:hypothetical protein
LEDKRFLVIAGALTAASANVLALPLIVHHFQSQGSACTLGVLVEPSLRIVAIVLVGAFGTGGVSGVASHGLRLCRNSPGEEEVSLEDASGEDKLDAESGEGDLSVVCEQVDLDAVGSSDEENRKNKKPQTPDSFKRRSNMQQPDSPTRKFHFGASGASQVGSPTKSLTGVISFDQYSGSPDLFDEQ